jgi:hypothetical protein
VFDLVQYQALLAGVAAAKTNNEKGAAFEELSAYLFSSLEGVEVTHRDARMSAEEIDLVLWNAQIEPVLKPWDDVILVECKKWSEPVGASVLDNFVAKLGRRSCTTGIFVAANGVTGGFVNGDGDEVGAAQIMRSSLQNGIRIVVLTLEDLQRIASVDDIRNLIKTRYCGLYVHRVF